MQDRFKFRHWDKQIKQMRYGDIQLGCDGQPFVITNNKEKPVEDIKDVVTMQCTGLKDKNGKLIYEGDIVKQNNTIYSVNWFNGSFCFKDTLNGKNYTVEFVMSEKQEVIGNIYENEDLLKCENQ